MSNLTRQSIRRFHNRLQQVIAAALQPFATNPVNVVGIGSLARGTFSMADAYTDKGLDADFNVCDADLFQQMRQPEARALFQSVADALRNKLDLAASITEAGLRDDDTRYIVKFTLPDESRGVKRVDLSFGDSEVFKSGGIYYAEWFSEQQRKQSRHVAGLRRVVAHIKERTRGDEVLAKKFSGGNSIESLVWQCGKENTDYRITFQPFDFERLTTPTINRAKTTVRAMIAHVSSPEGTETSPLYNMPFLIAPPYDEWRRVLKGRSKVLWESLLNAI